MSIEDGSRKPTAAVSDMNQHLAQSKNNITAPTYGPFKPLQSFEKPEVTLRLKFDPLKITFSSKIEQKTLRVLPKGKKRKLKLLDQTLSKHDLDKDTPKYGKRQLIMTDWVNLTKDRGGKAKSSGHAI